jgi:hypothetical protein
MLDQITTAYITALFLIFAGYVAGYVVGRLDIIYNTLRALKRVAFGAEPAGAPSPVERTTQKSRTFSATEPAPKSTLAPIDINTSTFVTAVNTAGMERAGSGELGKTTAVQDDIGSSVSKLAQLKGK